MHIFIIATNHHIIQVQEAIKYYHINTSDAILLFLTVNSQDLKVDLLPNGLRSKTFQSWTFKDIITQIDIIRDYIKYLKQIKRKYNNNIILYSNQYSSDFVLLAYNILKPAFFYLMDEGTASFKISHLRKQTHIINSKLFFKSILYFRFLRYPSFITYFSQYRLTVTGHDKLDVYDFEPVNNNISLDEKSIIVLGTSLSDCNIIKTDRYISILKAIYEENLSLGVSEFLYYPHRKEMMIKIETIKKIGYKIIYIDKPFEFVFKELSTCPHKIYNFLSPILDTLSKKYINIPIFYVVEFNDNDLINCKKEVYRDIYQNYKNNSRLIIKKY